ncbi:MAG TPA: type VI secretion system-associated protein TagF [Rhodopila sp.]|nr:type VI secretion system-associated protein TagF [Rhodopila sp.]
MAAMSSLRWAVTSRPPGCYGKLPARADFVGRRLAGAAVACWDAWTQTCLVASQAALGVAWQSRYLTAPVWRFALPAHACGPAGLVGVFVASADQVGRCFPFLLAQELPEMVSPVAIAVTAGAWFEAAETLVLKALDRCFDLAVLDRPMPAIIRPDPIDLPGGSAIGHAMGRWMELPMLSALNATLRATDGIGRQSALWWTTGGGGFQPGVAITKGLIPPLGFAALLDGAWERHGWGCATASTTTDGGSAWDRES